MAERSSTTSLVIRTGLTLGLIVTLALVSITASVFIADRMEGDAGAINVAGSLRMQAYRVALVTQTGTSAAVAVAVEGFDTRLNSPSLVRSLQGADRAPLRHAWQGLAARWQSKLRPLLMRRQPDVARYLAEVNDFVIEADRLVHLLQQASEEKVQLLRLIQGTAVFVTLAVVFVALYGLHMRVIEPLSELVAVARRTGLGDFSARVSFQADDELGVLGQAFNTMADDLSQLYDDLENRVREQTAALQRNHDALALQFRLSRLFAEPDHVQAQLPVAMRLLSEALHATVSFITTANTPGGDFRLITAQGEFPSSACRPGHGGVSPTTDGATPRQVRLAPVTRQERQYGQLCVEPQGPELDELGNQILQSAAEVLASALSLSDAEEQQRRLLLMKERAVIARELHDSLAQSLSYLKIQVSRLDTLVDRQAEPAELRPVLDDLREGLNSAYRQLRELLTTFRLRIEESGLAAALSATAEEFRARGLSVHLDYRLQHCPLSAGEEVHVLQIVREAVSNVLRHAHAEQVRVDLHQRADGRIAATIADDGIGMPKTTPPGSHHGLIIIRERTATLGGTVEWRPTEPHGTTVAFDFRPAYLAASSPAS